MALRRSSAVRRFSLFLSASVLWKLAALFVAVFLLVRFGRGV